uniref:RNase H type-1 domain-containing protein n=1 Tax=Cannabis sativa TaxID=3483 RepID=A0A803Q3C6_CANSA
MCIWNERRVRQWFHHDDARHILNIGLPNAHQGDSWRWLGEPNGLFSIKSAYHIITRRRYGATPSGIWKIIWNNSIHARLKFLWWQIITNALPTRERIAMALNLQSTLCPICNKERESSFHLFWNCDYASAAWFGSLWGIRTNLCPSQNWEEWMDWFGCMRNRPPNLSFIEFMTGALCIFEVIWKMRNELIHNGQLGQIMVVIQQASRRLNDHLVCKLDRPLKQAISLTPSEGWMTCCTDVSIGIDHSVGAAVFRDSKNRIWSVVADRFSATNSALAESLILVCAVQHAVRLELSCVNFFSDNVCAISNILETQGVQRCIDLEGTSAQFRSLSAQLRRWHLKHINRKENFMAHNVAKWAKLNAAVGDIDVKIMDSLVFNDCKEWHPDAG